MITKEGTLKMDNVLIIKKRVHKDELNNEVERIQTFFSKHNIKPANAPISFSNSEEDNNNESIVPLQWIMPLEEEIEDNFQLPKGFKFRKKVRIRNIIKIRHKGHPNDLPKTKQKLLQFLNKNNYERSTAFHYISLSDMQNIQDVNDFEMDIFVGTKKCD